LKNFVLIVGGGIGTRMGEGIPKQFILLDNKPILFHTIDKFSALADIALVLPPDHFSYWDSLCENYNFQKKVTLIAGGNSRFDSVYQGLCSFAEDGIVAIHDAVRPLVSAKLISELFKQAYKVGNAVPCIPIRDSLRKLNGLNNTAVNRSEYTIIQTPQCFAISEIKKAYEIVQGKDYTDDASIFESAGGKIHLIEGEACNIKITYKEDLFIAKALIDSEKL
jgi:2-C-methyl-D-erythritol 4-phosphate cytidylyltransferase